ncbi:unnamed protein product [Nezara viridula]|uniref:Uncharacterized protein n=1 Tax=Nezara viridula TaxID=85310 RepID=A0A9P0HJR5_NEZVI|nr:unnamed protein product [Nezara viridula]
MEAKDFRERALRRVKEGLGRLCRRRSVTITEYDPSFKVLYLGNVLTAWAKGGYRCNQKLRWIASRSRRLAGGRSGMHLAYLRAQPMV